MAARQGSAPQQAASLDCGLQLSDERKLSMFARRSLQHRIARREQKLRCRIVLTIAISGEGLVDDGIAVDTALRAGVVLADVPRLKAAALLPIAAQTRIDRAP